VVLVGPLLLDKASENNHFNRLVIKGKPPSELSIDAESIVDNKDESNGKEKHFELAKSAYTSHSPLRQVN
jgi:hypothetical protein